MDNKNDDESEYFHGNVLDFSDNLDGFSTIYLPDETLSAYHNPYQDQGYETMDLENDHGRFYDENRLTATMSNSHLGTQQFDQDNKLTDQASNYFSGFYENFNSMDAGNLYPTKRKRKKKMEIKEEENKGDIPFGDIHNEPQVFVQNQPPVEVRTRTPSERRNFSCSVIVAGDYKSYKAKFVTVELLYSSASLMGEENEIPKQTILGGTKTVAIRPNGTGVFDNLSMSEGSIRHKEREFCLRFILLDKDGNKLKVSTHSTAFYAYSNTKVLARRRDIDIRALSSNVGLYRGGEQMHIIGNPFIKGPSLKLIFRTPHGDVAATNLELYSETVLFFKLPPYPDIDKFEAMGDGVKVDVMVTNDGRNFSNAIEFYYVSGKQDPSLRSYL